MTCPEIDAYLKAEFPQVFASTALSLEHAERGEAMLRLRPGDAHLRPGGVISGPTLMLLCDAAAYAALLSLTPEAKMAVTSNLNISFLRAGKPGRDVVQHARVIKSGRRLAVIVCEAFDRGEDGVLGAALAHASMTYAMPSP